MYIVTQNSKGVAAVYTASEDEARLFENEPERFPDDLSGWVIESQSDISFKMSKGQMVSVYNQLAGESLVKFQNKDAGASRTFPLVERNAKPFDELTTVEAEVETVTDKPKTARRGRTDKGVHNIPPKDRAVACRAGTKQQLLIDKLAAGATMQELIDAMASIPDLKPWTEGSVKSGFYEDVNTKKGYGVRTEIVVEGDPSTYKYFLVYPEGVDAPLPSNPIKKAKEDTDS